MTVQQKRSVCPYDCPDACGLLVDVIDGKAVKVSGDKKHPHTRGILCGKMARYEQTVHSKERLLTPLVRSGPKGSGEFRAVSWEEAIGKIAAHWQDIIAESGAEAILPYSYAGTMGLVQRNCGEAFFHRLGASRLLRTICSSAKGYGWSAVMGATLSIKPAEAADSDCIILWGTNAAATNLHFLQYVREAKAKGAKVLLIETYHTPTAAAADRVVIVRPGSDGALALGIIHVLIQEGLADEGFISRYVQGFAELKTLCLNEYSPEAVSAITGLPAKDIVDIARLYGKAKAPFISLGSGLSRYGNGAMSVRAITCLPAVVGAWQKPGGGLLASVGTGSAFNMNIVTRPDFITQPTRVVNMNQLGRVLTADQTPPVRSLYVYHANPAVVAPEQNAVLKGLSREDLFTVVHERFMTDTARYADIILPATTSLEHSDLYRAYGHYCLQRAYPALEPQGEAKSNWDVFCLLAEGLDFHEPFFQQTADDVIEALLAQPNAWLASVDLNKVRAGLTVELPVPENYKLNYRTPSGKIEILNPAEQDKLPCYKPPHGGAEPLWLMNGPGVQSLNSSFNERQELIERSNINILQMNPADALQRGLAEGEPVLVYNELGEVPYTLCITDKVPAGVVAAEGVAWIKNGLGERTVNALTSQRLTDKAEGSTFYDTKVEVRRK